MYAIRSYYARKAGKSEGGKRLSTCAAFFAGHLKSIHVLIMDTILNTYYPGFRHVHVGQIILNSSECIPGPFIIVNPVSYNFV